MTFRFPITVPVIILAACLCVTPQSTAADMFACVAPETLNQQIDPTAQLEELTCFFKNWEGQDVLHFQVSVKNISDQPQRYRVNIFLDNGKAVGGLIPRKTGKGLVDPGQSASFTYPVKGMTEKPQQIDLLIKPIAP
jgi:hypothetical protein